MELDYFLQWFWIDIFSRPSYWFLGYVYVIYQLRIVKLLVVSFFIFCLHCPYLFKDNTSLFHYTNYLWMLSPINASFNLFIILCLFFGKRTLSCVFHFCSFFLRRILARIKKFLLFNLSLFRINTIKHKNLNLDN